MKGVLKMMGSNIDLYCILNTDTGRYVSDLTNPSHKFWEHRKRAEQALENYKLRYREDMPRKYKYKPSSLKLLRLKCIPCEE